ncbi:hypothetical protein WJX77_000534 [Trebouxia sp. C0004]
MSDSGRAVLEESIDIENDGNNVKNTNLVGTVFGSELATRLAFLHPTAMTMTSSGTRDVVDLTQDEEDHDESLARVGCSNGLRDADQHPAQAAQLVGSDASHAHPQPQRPLKLQSAQHYPESHVQQATSAQQQQQEAHVLAQHYTPSQPRILANLTDPALHLLDHTLMMDALSVLTYSRAAAQKSDQPGFASLDVQYMQRLSQAQAVDQGRLLVFLEWLTVKMCQRGLLTEHMALVDYVVLSCQAAKDGVLISIKALMNMAAHTAPGYVQEYVHVSQGRQPEYEALAMFPWLQPIQAGGTFTVMQYLVAFSFFELRPIWEQQQQQEARAINPSSCGYSAESELQLQFQQQQQLQLLTGQLQWQQQQQAQQQQNHSRQQQPSQQQVACYQAENRLQLLGRATLHQAATHSSIGQQSAASATSLNCLGITLPLSPDPSYALHGLSQPVAPACPMPQSSRRHDSVLSTVPEPLRHAAMLGARAGIRSSSTPSELEERLSLTLKGEAAAVHGNDAADNLPFGRGKGPQVKEPLSVVFAPDTHASQKVSPSGVVLYSDLASHMKHRPYMCINPTYLKRCNDAELRLLSEKGLLRNRGLHQNQAWLSELSRCQVVAASAAWSQTHRCTSHPPAATHSVLAQAVGSKPHAEAAAQVAAPAAADTVVIKASALVNGAVKGVSCKPARAPSSARAESPTIAPATSAPAASAPAPSASDAATALVWRRDAAAHNVLVSSSESLSGPNQVPELSALPGLLVHLRPEAYSSNAQRAAGAITSQIVSAVPLSTAKEAQHQKDCGAAWTAAAAAAETDKAAGSPPANANMPFVVARPPFKDAFPKGTARESPVAFWPGYMPPKQRSSLTDRQTPASPKSVSLSLTAAASSTPQAIPPAPLLPSTFPPPPATQSAIPTASPLAASGPTPAVAAPWTVTSGHTPPCPLGMSQHQPQPQPQSQPQLQVSTTPKTLLSITVMAGGPSKLAEGQDDGRADAQAQQAASTSSEGSGVAREGRLYPFPALRLSQDRLAGIASSLPCSEEDSSHLYVFGRRQRTSADQNIPGPSAQATSMPDMSKPTNGTSPVMEAAAIDTSGHSLAPQAATAKVDGPPEAAAAGTSLASADAFEPDAPATSTAAAAAAESHSPDVAAVSASQPATAAGADPPAVPLAAATEAAPERILSSASAASVGDPASITPILHCTTQPSLPKKRKRSKYFSETFDVKKRRRNKIQRTKADNRAARTAGTALPSRARAESIWVHSSSWSGDSVSHTSASAQKHTGMLARDASGRFARLGQQVATAGDMTGQQDQGAAEASEANTGSASQDAMTVKQQGVDSGEEDNMQVDQQENDPIKSETQGQEVACSAPNLMSMLLPKPFVKPVWALDLHMSELEQQGYKSILEDAFVLVHDRDEQHLVQVKACHPDHDMQPVFTIQNGEEVRYEELSDAVHFEAHHVRLHQVGIITGKLPRLLLDEVAHANMEARTEQSMAYFELQEQLKQASLDSTAQQALADDIRRLTSRIMSRPSDAIYSRIDEDWKTQEEETRSFFVRLCGSKAEKALAEGHQSPSVKQEPATLVDSVVPDQHAVTSELVDALPREQPQVPTVEDAALPVDQEGLLGVHSRLESLLQDLPFQDALDAVSAQMPKSPPQASTPSAQGPDTAATAATVATAADEQPSPEQKLGQAPAKVQTDSGLATAASMPEGQAVPAALANPSGDMGNFKRSTATAMPALKKRKRAAVQAAAHATAVDAATAAVADANNGQSPIERQTTGNDRCWPERVQIVCNSMRGVFDAPYTMVTPSTGKRCRPSVFVQSAGMGHVGKWKETIKVDDGEGVPGIAIGCWLKEAKRNGLKQIGGRPQAAIAKAASPEGSDALVVAALADSEASPPGDQQANVKSPASSERATDAGISHNAKAAESQAGAQQLFKHDHRKPGVPCLACKEARRQKRILRQAQITQGGSAPQWEASPTEGVTDAKAAKLKGHHEQHGGSSMAVVTEDGQISSVAAEGPAWVAVERDIGGRPTSPFSKAAVQQHLKLGSGDKAANAPKMVSTAQLHSLPKPTKSDQVSKQLVKRPPKLNPLSTKNSPHKGSAAIKSVEAARPGLEAGTDVSVKAGVGVQPGVTLLTNGGQGLLPGGSHPQGSSNLSLAADGGDDEHPGASASKGLRSPSSPSSPTSPSHKSAVSSRKQISLEAVLSHDSGQTPSEKLASPPNRSSQSVSALSKKVSLLPSPAPASALTSPEKVTSPPNPFDAAAATAPQPSVEGVALTTALTSVQKVTSAGKMDLNTRAQPQMKISTKRKRLTEAAARNGAAKKGSANFGGLSLVPLPKAKPSLPERLLTEEQMDEDQPCWAGRNAPHLPSWPGPFGANSAHAPAAGAGLWVNYPPYMAGTGHSAWPASGLQSQPGSSGQMISGAGSHAAAPMHAGGRTFEAHATGQGPLRSPAPETTQPHETFNESHELPEPGEGSKAAGGVFHHLRPHPSGQSRQQPHKFLRSLGLHEHSQDQHGQIEHQPSPQAPGMLTASSNPRQSVSNSERQHCRLSMQTLGSSASQDGSQHPQGPNQRPQGSSQQPQGRAREQYQLQSQGPFSALQSTRQHPPGSNRPPQGSNQHPQPSLLLSRGSRVSQTTSGAGSQSDAFGTLRPIPISAQPQSMRVKLSYNWGTNSSVSGVLDLMAHSWSTSRVGRSWAGAGYTDTPLNSMLMPSVFMGTLKSERSLSTSAWQSSLCEWWDGNLVVFTLPQEVAANCLQAATASMNLARVIKLLRNGDPLTTSLSVAQTAGRSVCKQHTARLWLTRLRGVTDTLLDMLSQEAKTSLEEVVPGLLQKRDDAKHSYIIGLITLTGGTV